MIYVIATFNILIIALCIIIFRKVRNVHLEQFQLGKRIQRLADHDLVESFRQSQELEILTYELGFERPLPPTRGWAGSPDFLRVLVDLYSTHNPKTIVECSSGVSSLVLGRCMQKAGEGHVYSLEHDNEFKRATETNLELFGLSEYVSVRYSPLSKCQIKNENYDWYSLDDFNVGGIDMLVIDGPPKTLGKLARYPALPKLLPFMADDCVIVMDDANRADEKEIIRRWCEEFDWLDVTFRYCEKGCAVLSRV